MKKIWTDDKIEYLRKNIDKYSNKELAVFFDVTVKAVSMILTKKNINRSNIKRWTKREIKFLKDNVDKYTNRELSTLLNVTKQMIDSVLYWYSIKRKNSKFIKKDIAYKEVYKVDYLDSPCWECTSHHLDRCGYPMNKVNSKQTTMSRNIYEEYYKTIIPKNMVIRHKCDNPPCINPLHLDIGTMQDNSNDMVSRGRQLKGSQKFSAKLTEEQVIEIKRKLLLDYEKGDIRRFAKKYKVGVGIISNIRNNKDWKHIKID
jgi:hypothetical protein